MLDFMAKTWKVRRNIRKNITRYDKTHSDPAGMFRRLFSKLLAILLVLILPFIGLIATSNLVFRIPDLYNFDLSRSMSSDEINLKLEGGEVGRLISGYMLHKTDYFQIRANFQGREKPVFSVNDGMNAGRYRNILDKSLIMLCVILPLFLICCVLLYQLESRRLLRRSYQAGCIFFVLICALLFWGIQNETARVAVLRGMINIRETTADILPELFGDGFRLAALAAIIVLSLVIIGIGHSVIRALTKEEKIFKRDIF
jgi:hypothetical protein